MSKFGIGLICGGFLVGLLIIFLGRTIYPEISLTFRIGWVIFAGVMTGGASGLIFQFTKLSLPMDIAVSTLTGIILFGLLTVFLSIPTEATLILGIAIGGVSGGLIKLWSVLNVQKN